MHRVHQVYCIPFNFILLDYRIVIAMFRFSLWALLGSAEAVGDETSLMQGLKPLQDLKRRHDKHAVSNLLESAKGMLRNGETEDVVAFARATLDEILDSVLPAISDASAVEQRSLDFHFDLFGFLPRLHEESDEGALQLLENWNKEIHMLNEEERAISSDHKTCRADEDVICGLKLQCDCNAEALQSMYFAGESYAYSYATCGSADEFAATVGGTAGAECPTGQDGCKCSDPQLGSDNRLDWCGLGCHV